MNREIQEIVEDLFVALDKHDTDLDTHVSALMVATGALLAQYGEDEKETAVKLVQIGIETIAYEAETE